MPKFSRISAERLATCHPDLQKIFNEVIKKYDCTIICGVRTNEEQDNAFACGASKLKGGQSKHNLSPALAVDVAPYPIDWENKNRFYHFAGYVEGVAENLNIAIRWGGDWDGDKDFKDQSFNDLVHFELT